MSTLAPLVDSHNHLQEEVLQPYLPEVLQRAREAGVAVQVVNGTAPGDWAHVLALAQNHPDLIPCFGLHPWFVGQAGVPAPPGWVDMLRHHLSAIPSALGEIGLDRWVKERDEAAQEEAFVLQLRLARELGLPVMIHCLKAWGWLLEVLGREGAPPAGMLIHAFGGAAEMIPPLQQMGAYFSFGGSVLDEQRLRARQSLQAVPLERLLIETDAPALLPSERVVRASRPQYHVIVGDGGEEYNEPANLPLILHGIAQLRGVPEEELREIVWENAQRLLGPLMPSVNVT